MKAQALTFLLLALAGCGRQAQQPDNGSAALSAKQAQVAERGRSVMPFDLNRTMHHFKPLPSGGVQEVLATVSHPEQVRLIREHLRKEAIRFQHGDFSDPAAIHGRDMPGVRALSAGAGQIEIRYADIPGGARIDYSTRNPALVAAIHAWFAAQVREHGHNAMPM